MNNKKNSDPNSNPIPQGPRYDILDIIIKGLIFALLINIFVESNLLKKQTLPFNKFVNLVEQQQVKSVSIKEQELNFVLIDGFDKDKVKNILLEDIDQSTLDNNALRNLENNTQYKTYNLIGYYENLLPSLTKNNVDITLSSNSSILSFILSWVVPIIFFILIYRVFSSSLKGMASNFDGIDKVGKSSAKKYNKDENIKVTFKDVAGLEEAKESLFEIIDFLENPKKYEKIGARLPKGALLVGPPGTGKTLIARAVAGEASVPFFSLSGSEFVEMYVGVGAKRVRDLFGQANKDAPCIIFIDEIDAIGKKRDNSFGSNDEREQTLNQLLTEMDGFDSSKGIIILAATNRPEILDKALLRPGRFDRQIIIERPDLIGREAILQVHSNDVILSKDVDLKIIALSTSGASGADLANMINEAALRAVRLGRNEVLQEDILESVEVVIAGKEKKDRILSEKEKMIVSYHEIGHALVSALQKNTMPVQKITIVPRTMGSLGYVMSVPEEEKFINTKSELLAQITTTMGGRASEELIFNEKSTGASNDIEQATNIARQMVTMYGMSDKFGMMGLETIQDRYLEGRSVSNYSEQTGKEIDVEIKNILDGCYNTAYELLKNNTTKLHALAKFLFEKENITGVEFMEILNSLEDKKEEKITTKDI